MKALVKRHRQPGLWLEDVPKPEIGINDVCCFALSDVFIVILVPHLGTGFAAAARSVGVVYGICGLAALPLLPWQGSRRQADWLAVVPYVACWLPRMYLLFASLALCGPVLGNIVIGTRGLFAIVLGAILANRGLLHIEHHATADVVLRRAAAAVLMIVAIALYGLGIHPQSRGKRGGVSPPVVPRVNGLSHYPCDTTFTGP